jgi:hypothetical protein
MEEEKRIIWLPEVASWKALVGSCTLQWEDVQKLSEALCWDREALRHDDEKETSSGVFEEPVEWERDWTKNRMNEVR